MIGHTPRRLRVARIILRAYPLSWRTRYEQEVLALLEDGGASAWQLLDLARGCAAARVRTIGRIPTVQTVGAILALWLISVGPGFVVGRALRWMVGWDLPFEGIGTILAAVVFARLMWLARRNARLNLDWGDPGRVFLGPWESAVWRVLAFTAVSLTMADDRSLDAFRTGLPVLRLMFTPALLASLWVDQHAHRPWFLIHRGLTRPPNVPTRPLGLS
jgi:hypothetical protein